MSLPNDFVGADLEAGRQLASALEKASRSLSQGATRLRQILGSVDLPTGPASTVGQMGGWAVGQAAEVRRRLNELEQADKEAADGLSGLPP
jgi:hypothetical protein